MSTTLNSSKTDYLVESLRRIVALPKGADPVRRRLASKALSRIRDDTYGYCLSCGLNIPERDMERVPERQYCTHCQQ